MINFKRLFLLTYLGHSLCLLIHSTSYAKEKDWRSALTQYDYIVKDFLDQKEATKLESLSRDSFKKLELVLDSLTTANGNLNDEIEFATERAQVAKEFLEVFNSRPKEMKGLINKLAKLCDGTGQCRGDTRIAPGGGTVGEKFKRSEIEADLKAYVACNQRPDVELGAKDPNCERTFSKLSGFLSDLKTESTETVTMLTARREENERNLKALKATMAQLRSLRDQDQKDGLDLFERYQILEKFMEKLDDAVLDMKTLYIDEEELRRDFLVTQLSSGIAEKIIKAIAEKQTAPLGKTVFGTFVNQQITRAFDEFCRNEIKYCHSQETQDAEASKEKVTSMVDGVTALLKDKISKDEMLAKSVISFDPYHSSKISTMGETVLGSFVNQQISRALFSFCMEGIKQCEKPQQTTMAVDNLKILDILKMLKKNPEDQLEPTSP